MRCKKCMSIRSMIFASMIIGVVLLHNLLSCVAQKYPWGLVGPVPRAHSDNSPKMTYAFASTKNGYSLILTSAAFLHREYLRLFEDKCVSKIREDIDRNKNCEDIFMNFLVKEHCNCSGVFYKDHGNIAAPKNLSRMDVTEQQTKPLQASHQMPSKLLCTIRKLCYFSEKQVHILK